MNAALKRQFESALATDESVAQQKQSRGREIGTVENYDRVKGFGFVVDSEGESMFVHQSQIISPGFRRLEDGQKISFVRGENRGKPWAEDVRNPDGTPVDLDGEAEKQQEGLSKKRRQQLREQWRNFFEIPQYHLKSYAESLPPTAFNQDTFVLNETCHQLGNIFVMSHGCCPTASKANECTAFVREKVTKHLTKAYEEKNDTAAALASAFELLEADFIERAKMKSLTDGAEIMLGLFVHALDASGRPCVQLWIASVGSSVALLCSADGAPVRLNEPHVVKKERESLEAAGFKVSDSGVAEVAFAEQGQHKPSSTFKLPSARLLGGRPFKTSRRSPVTAEPTIRKVKEWRCVSGEELFLIVVSQEVASVLSDSDAMNAALDAWGSSASGLDGWEAAAKAVVRTAQSQGPEKDTIACMAVQFWWQEKPLQRLIARRADRKRTNMASTEVKAADEGFDMFG